MKKHLIAFAVMALAAGGAMAQANDTIAKVKASHTGRFLAPVLAPAKKRKAA